MPQQIQIRRDSTAQWTANNPVLAKGEWAAEYNGNALVSVKLGNGVDRWASLPPFGGGSVSVSDVIGLAAALDAKAPSSHTHSQSQVTGLSTALSGKADSSHTHSQSQVTGLANALSGKADSSHTHSQSQVTGLSTALSGKANTSHTHDVDDLDIFPGGTGMFLRADGTWASPPSGGGSGVSIPTNTVMLSLSDDWNAAYAAAAVPTRFIHEAGTKTISAPLSLPGRHAYDYRGTTVTQGNGANLAVLAATSSYFGNTTTVDEPLTILGGTFNCNGANNTGTTGLVVRAYRATVRDTQVIDPLGDGIVVSTFSANGTTLPTGTMVENTLDNCKVFAQNNTTGACFRIRDGDATAKATDGYMTSCLAFGGAHGLLAEQSGGWHFDGFHSYACDSHGMYVFNPNATRISNIYLEGWGRGQGWRVGLWLSGVQARGCTVLGGTIHSFEHSSGTSIGVLATGAGSVEASLIANVAVDGSGHAGVTDTGFVIEGGSGGSMTYNISGSLTKDCDTELSTGGTVIDAGPSSGGGGGPVSVPSGLSATGTPSATTFLRGDGRWAVPAGGSGGGTGGAFAIPGCHVISADAPSDVKTALSALPNVFICDGTNDQVEIQAAINYAAPLYSRNSSSGVSGVSTQMGTVKLSGGQFNISGANGIKLRTGVRLEGSGWLTELRAVSCSAPGMIQLNSPNEHVVHVSNLWLNGNGSAGGTCSGIDIDGNGSTQAGMSTYPSSNPDQYNYYGDLFITNFDGGTGTSAMGMRRGIALRGGVGGDDEDGSHDRGWMMENLQIRRISGTGIFVEGTTDGYIGNTHVGTVAYGETVSESNAMNRGKGVGIYVAAANVKCVNNKAFFCEGWGIVADSNQAYWTGLEVQENPRGLLVRGRAMAMSSVMVDSCMEGIRIDTYTADDAHPGVSIHSFTITNNAPRYGTTPLTVGVRIEPSITNISLIGNVYTQALGTERGPITSKITGTVGTGSFVRIGGGSGLETAGTT